MELNDGGGKNSLRVGEVVAHLVVLVHGHEDQIEESHEDLQADDGQSDNNREQRHHALTWELELNALAFILVRLVHLCGMEAQG